MKFIRPESLEFPTVYHTFMAKDRNSDKNVQYRIQDLLTEDFEEAVGMLLKYYLPEEPLCMAHNYIDNPDTVRYMGEFYRNLLNDRISLGCYREGSDDLVGINVMDIKFAGEIENHEDSNKDFMDKALLIDYAESQFDIFENYHVDKYLTSYALLVHPDYRNRGIAMEILKGRVPLMKALNIEVTATVFSSIGSQVAATRAGFVENFVISYSELQEKFPKFDFSKISSTLYKKMSLKI